LIVPFGEKNTDILIDCFTDEINDKYMGELAYPIPPDACELEGGDASDVGGPHGHLKLVFVGGGHASRMAAAANRRSLHVVNLAVPSMRVTEASVKEASARLKEELAKSDGIKAVIIYRIYAGVYIIVQKQYPPPFREHYIFSPPRDVMHK
jgi:hypothetical protein